ncbi:MAG: HEAT repeat domain-containing protein [Verrucomicrobiia bacterium]
MIKPRTNLESETTKSRSQPARFAARRLATAMLAVFASAALASELAVVQPTFHSSFEAASSAATADQSLVLLIFGAEWCGPCKLLKSKTLSSAEFLRQESPLHVAEVDIDANPKMAGDFDIEAVPTLILLTGDGKIIARQTGFMEAADLIAWLQAGRNRAAAGQWEGAAPGAQFDEFIKKAAADNLTTNDLQRLVGLLGDTDPANREQAGKILLAQREQAVPSLIEAVGNRYLGVRISATELLQQLAPDITPVDPWQSPAEMSNRVVALRKWWAETGRLPTSAGPRTMDSVSENSIKAELEQLRGDDPVQRTAAMTALVSRGADALPAVHEAIKRAERSSDPRTLGLLEDVLWTILVPDAVEQQSSGVRKVLARGKSSERQAAAERLGRIGRDALGALAELANDPDPLVVESAIRALSDIGGNDTVPALAALLNSADSNLRMTAAQALGHTKSPAAVKPLLAAMSDSDEVVACTALSALEETQAREYYNSNQREFSEEITIGLKQCLADSRWRVRTAAAEVVGKLNAGQLADDLKKLLDDSDGFVVKSALTALSQLHAVPESGQLVALSKRIPSLQGDAVAMMLQSASDDVDKTITELFNSGTIDSRMAILNALAQKETSDETKSDEEWKPLLTQAIAATDPRLRHGAAAALEKLSPRLAVQLIGPLLADEDRNTRLAAADAVLRILDHDSGGSLVQRTFFSFSGTTKTNKPAANAAQIAAWHAAMLQHVEPAPALNLAAAVFATGDGKTDLPMLLVSLEKANVVSNQSPSDQRRDMTAIELALSKLPWPEGRPVLDKLSASPLWFAMAASLNGQGKPGVADYLLDPARFKSAVEPAGGSALSETLELLAGYDYEYGGLHKWSLWTETDRTKAVALALADSTNAAWRAAAVFSLGLRMDAKDHPDVFEKAIADPNPWVRASAVRAIARNTTDRPALEQRLAPMLADTNLTVATVAAVALLEPETRQAAGLEDKLNYFEFNDVRGGRSQSNNQNNDRPLTILEGKPPFLQQARDWLAATNGDESVSFALLLAQYGEFEGVDKLVAQLPAMNSERDQSAADALLAGIALSRDIKYLPALKQMASTRREEWELRKVLQALKGMSGPDARQLRLDINKKIRNAGGSSGIPSDF